MPYHPGVRYAESLVDAVAITRTKLHTHEKIIAGQRCLRQIDHAFVTPDLAPLPRVRFTWTDPDQIASDQLPRWLDLD